MALTKLQFKPGINREGTNYSNEGGWFDGKFIRFTNGFVEKIGGWKKVSANTFEGSIRAMRDFTTLESENYLFLGSEKKIYLENGGFFNDITPIRKTTSPLSGSTPIATGSSGSGIVTVTDSSHGAVVGDFVTLSGATTVDGVTAAQLNKEHEITVVVNSNSYKVDTGGSASSGSTSGGGGSVVAAYQINIGLNTTVLGAGWGAGGYSRGTWNSASGSLAATNLRLWYVDTFGEDVITNIANGSIYFWDATSGTARAVELNTLTGSNEAPTIAKIVLVSEVDRHILAFGANIINTTDQDPLLIRWSDQESAIEWEPKSTNTAGDLRLSQGSEIVTAVTTTRQILVWTDKSLHSVQFVGAPFTFGSTLIANNTRIMAPNTAISVNDLVFWMGKENFYMYDGRIQTIPCPVREYVFSDMNATQSLKFYAGSIASQSEVWFWYCSEDSNEIDRYVVFNFAENAWYYGDLARTAWNDTGSGFRSNPQAPGTDNFLYDHEEGLDDGSTTPASAINAYIESADFDIEDGTKFMLIRKVLPDLTFNGSTTGSPSATFTMTSRSFPGGGAIESPSDSVTRTVSAPIEQYTNQLFLRARGRQMAIKVENTATGVQWRLGSPRLDARPDGGR